MLADDRACTPLPPINLHGKEGVDGSSPLEGFRKGQQIAFFVVTTRDARSLRRPQPVPRTRPQRRRRHPRLASAPASRGGRLPPLRGGTPRRTLRPALLTKGGAATDGCWCGSPFVWSPANSSVRLRTWSLSKSARQTVCLAGDSRRIAGVIDSAVRGRKALGMGRSRHAVDHSHRNRCALPAVEGRMTACGSCGHENQSGQKFCGECGARLGRGAPAVVEERKVVSVALLRSGRVHRGVGVGRPRGRRPGAEGVFRRGAGGDRSIRRRGREVHRRRRRGGVRRARRA